MRSAVIRALLCASLAASMATTGSDGGTDFLYGTDGASVTISGTQDGSAAPESAPGDFTSSGDPRFHAPFRRCEVSSTSISSCDAENTPPTVASGAEVTIAQIAQFAPAPFAAVVEPGNVGIAGLPANFLADGGAHTRNGSLFGIPVAVRFTPIGYVYRYGDGTSATLRSAGSTWAALGRPPFTPTSTSHVYRRPGTYLADIDIQYRAEVDLGSGWLRVAGTLTTDGPPQEIRILDAHTALVAHTCDEDPAAPGC